MVRTATLLSPMATAMDLVALAATVATGATQGRAATVSFLLAATAATAATTVATVAKAATVDTEAARAATVVMALIQRHLHLVTTPATVAAEERFLAAEPVETGVLVLLLQLVMSMRVAVVAVAALLAVAVAVVAAAWAVGCTAQAPPVYFVAVTHLTSRSFTAAKSIKTARTSTTPFM